MHTIVKASILVGLILPGIIEEPGSFSGNNNSPKPERGPEANKKRIQDHVSNSLMLVTALNKHIGYDNAAKIAKKALENNTKLKEEALKSGLITEKEYNKIVDPKKMISPK